MSGGPLFTFLTAAYDAEATLAETIGSVASQSSGDWELVIVDDGSTDRTGDIARRCAADDPRIAVLSQRNAGAAAARNRAAGVARGRWWCVLDADDVIDPRFVERMAGFIAEHPGYGLYSCSTLMRFPDGRTSLFDDRPRASRVVSFTLDEMLRRNRLPVTTVFSPDVHALVGGFRDVYAEDYDFWLRALALGVRHIHDPEVLAIYNVAPTGKNAARCTAAASTAELVADLAAMPGLPAATARLARRMSEYYSASCDRWALESRLRAGDRSGARRAYLRCRDAYLSRWKYPVGLAVMLLSPRAFAALMLRRAGEAREPAGPSA